MRWTAASPAVSNLISNSGARELYSTRETKRGERGEVRR